MWSNGMHFCSTTLLTSIFLPTACKSLDHRWHGSWQRRLSKDRQRSQSFYNYRLFRPRGGRSKFFTAESCAISGQKHQLSSPGGTMRGSRKIMGGTMRGNRKIPATPE